MHVSTCTKGEICYLVPAFLFDGITIIIAHPLNSVIRALTGQRVKVISLHSGSSSSERMRIYDMLTSDSTLCRIVVVTSDVTATKDFRALIDKLHDLNLISLIVINDAQCIASMSYDYREDFCHITQLRTNLHDVPFLIMAASAPPDVEMEIFKHIHLKKIVSRSRQPAFRSNICIDIVLKDTITTDVYKDLAQFISSSRQI